ncbi:MAG: DUF308 domain-containing protein [bacterium]
MKEWINKISVSFGLAVCELLLGIALLANPAGLVSMVIIISGVLLIAAGALNVFHYLRLSREEATQTWHLAHGAGFLAAGLIAVCNQHWLVQIMGTLTTLYALVVLVSSFMKLQIAVDAFRGSRPFWYLMAVSTICAIIIAALLFFHPLPETATWIVAGIALILTAVLDGAYFWMGRK